MSKEAILYNSAAQTFTTAGSYTVVAQDTVAYDPDGMANTGADANFLIKEAGDYEVEFFFNPVSGFNVNDQIWTGFSKNGANLNGTFLIHRIEATGTYGLGRTSGTVLLPNLAINDRIRAIIRAIANNKTTGTGVLYARSFSIRKV